MKHVFAPKLLSLCYERTCSFYKLCRCASNCMCCVELGLKAVLFGSKGQSTISARQICHAVEA